jgi:hypothetical protein
MGSSIDASQAGEKAGAESASTTPSWGTSAGTARGQAGSAAGAPPSQPGEKASAEGAEHSIASPPETTRARIAAIRAEGAGVKGLSEHRHPEVFLSHMISRKGWRPDQQSAEEFDEQRAERAQQRRVGADASQSRAEGAGATSAKGQRAKGAGAASAKSAERQETYYGTQPGRASPPQTF